MGPRRETPVIGPPAQLAIEAGRRLFDLNVLDLWIDTVGLGGRVGIAALEEFLDGRSSLADGEYDVVALAINELFMEHSHTHPVPSADQLSAASASGRGWST